MDVEEPVQPRPLLGGPPPAPSGLPGDRRLDPQVGGRPAGGSHDRLVALKLPEGVYQARRVASQKDRIGIGKELAPARNGELEELCEQRREQQQHQPEYRNDPTQSSSAAPVAVASPPPHRTKEPVAQKNNHTDESYRECHYERVAILDVRQLVSDHTLELVARELSEKSGGDGDGGVLGIAAGGERVGGRVVDDVDPRLGDAGRNAESFDDVVELLVAG